jgi:hypothetical protein
MSRDALHIPTLRAARDGSLLMRDVAQRWGLPIHGNPSCMRVSFVNSALRSLEPRASRNLMRLTQVATEEGGFTIREYHPRPNTVGDHGWIRDPLVPIA